MPSASSKSSQMPQPAPIGDLLQEPLKNAVSVADKKLRNLEKRKLKLLETKKKADEGAELNEDQKKALDNLRSVDNSLEAVKDVKKNLTSLENEYGKLLKKEQKRQKQEQKDQVEVRNVEVIFSVIEIQGILSGIDEEVRADFLSGNNGACKLSKEELEELDTIYEMMNPEIAEDKPKKLSERVKVAGEHTVSLVEGRNKIAFDEVTYKEIHDIILKIKESGYFDKDVSNGNEEAVVETEEAVADEVEEQRPAEVTTTTAAGDVSPGEEYSPTGFQEATNVSETNVPVNGVDLPPEVQKQETLNEKIDFLSESEIAAGAAEPQSLNPVSPEFVPRNFMNNPGEKNRQDSGESWQQVEGGQQGSGNYRGRGGRGGRGGNFRGGRGGRGGNFRGGQRDGNYRGGNRGGSRGGNRGGNREGGNYRGGGQRGDGNRGGSRGRGGRGGNASGGVGHPNQ